MTNRRKLSLTLVIALFVASMGANVGLYILARDYYYDLQRVHFDPLGLDKDWVDGPAADQTNVVFFGDSRAAQWTSPEMNGLEFVNRGIGGHTSNQIMLRYDAHIEPLEPDVLVVQMCVNELKMVAIFPDEREEILDSCRQNTLDLIDRADQAGATVILTTVFPVGKASPARRPVWSNDVAVAVDEINAFLRQQSAENVILLDTFELLAGDSGLIDPQYARDLLHLNRAGYELLNTHLVDALESIQLN